MDKAIFEMQFLRKVLLAPITDCTHDFIRVNSGYMDTDLCGMDSDMYHERIREVRYREWTQATIITKCNDWTNGYLREIAKREDIGNITSIQMNTVRDMMSFFLSHARFCQDQRTGVGRDSCYNLLWHLNTFLLRSNKLVDCEAWIKEHLPELKALRSTMGDSLLHMAAKRVRLGHDGIPFVRILIVEGEMDVNVVNLHRDTALHLLSSKLHYKLPHPGSKTADMVEVCELLINHGAHMDAKNNKGHEASGALSPYFPKWSFNFGLKCLAARAVLEHGISYEKVPAQLVSFIDSHKPVSSPKSTEHNPRKRKM